jgi:hypothetical protein
MARIFELRKEQCGLRHLFGQSTLNVMKTRWLKFLSEYDFEIKHIKGKQNQVSYALCRREHKMYMETINMHITYLKDNILDFANSHQQYLLVEEKL